MDSADLIRFDKWNALKKDLQRGKKRLLHIREREIYFTSIGKNVGYESYGKGEHFLRPVLVLKKISRSTFIGIPLTSKQKEGSYYYAFEYKKGITSVAMFNQIRVFDIKRIQYYSGSIKKEDFEKLKESISLFFNITPSKGEGGIPTKSEQRNNRNSIAQMHNDVKYFAHKSVYIDDKVSIGKDTKIWHFSHILSYTTIGENCSFGQNCVVGPKVTIGNGVKVQNNISIYEGVAIEDDVFLGPSMVFTNVINPRAFIQRKDEFKKTLLKKGCSIGANATIVCGVTIGEYALIGSGAVVNKDVKPYALMVGVPARQIGWVGISGNTLHFDNEGRAIDSDGRKYAIIDDMVKEIV